MKALYMDDPDLSRCTALVTKIDFREINKKRYKCVLLDQTIFHPKGGGQPSDSGTIDGVPVVYIYKDLLDKNRIDQFEILHCFDEAQELGFKESDEVELLIDMQKRFLYSKMHTAGHVLAMAVHDSFSFLEGYQGNHDPKEGYVKFRMHADLAVGKDEFMQHIQGSVEKLLDRDLQVNVMKNSDGVRTIQIGPVGMPCGGTHVHHLKEIGLIFLTDISINKNEKIVTIKYRLGENR